jgi:hypothetical protein
MLRGIRTEVALVLERREFLRALTLLIGAPLSSSCAAWVLQGCSASRRAAGPPLAPAIRELIDCAVERIIPTTDTPGARAAGVGEFIERMLAGWMEEGERERFLAGLEELDRLARQASAPGFAAASEAQQDDVLAELERRALAERDPRAPTLLNPLTRTAPPQAQIFASLKELTVVGYYTSEVGASTELLYGHLHGSYRACVPLGAIGRAWAE